MSLPNLDSFKAQFKGDLVFPSDPDYEQAIARWATNAQRRAALVTFPKDAEDVCEVVKWVSANKIPIAVRGGGHSSSGASSVEGGVIIDLSRHLTGARIDPERKLAFIGGGALWEEVDREAIKHGLATPGGTVNHTGVGGLTLGGGYGYLSSEHGLVIDNLQEATIVTGTGSILKCSAEENPDLFWGIRGGGGNFGVATEFVLRLHPQRRDVFAGFVIFPAPLIEKLFAASDEWFKTNDDRKASMLLVVANPPPKRRTMIAALVFYNGSDEEGRKHFKWLYDLGPVADKASETPYEYVNAFAAAATPHGQGICTTGAVQTAPDVAQKLYDAFVKYNAENPDMSIVFAYEYFGLHKIREVANDATAFPGRMAPPNIMLLCTFDGKAPNMEEMTGRARKILAELKEMTNSEAAGPAYGNYDDASTVRGYGEHFMTNVGSMAADKGNDAAESLFQDNYPRLQELKAKYDPNCIFNRWYGIAPKVKA